MTTQEIASRLIVLCQKGTFEAAQKELFAKDAVSVEPYATPAFEKETKGLDAILEKGAKWGAMVSDTHGMKISEPLVAGNAFSLTMDMDVTMKEGGRMKISELCVYQVKDGKIVREEFYM